VLTYSRVSYSVAKFFSDAYRQVRPQGEVPEISIEFFPFANVNSTIRLRDGKLIVRLSDLLEGAPRLVLQAIAHILIAKLCRQPVPAAQSARYRKYLGSRDLVRRAHLVRQLRGRKHIASAKGHAYNLETIFAELNQRYFDGLLGQPCLTWSRGHARNRLGHYDPAHNAIVVSRIFDHPGIPRFVLDYIVFHEMLHLKFPVQLKGSRRCVHSREFLAEERRFPQWKEAQQFLRRL
jgi:hypothetical protein